MPTAVIDPNIVLENLNFRDRNKTGMLTSFRLRLAAAEGVCRFEENRGFPISALKCMACHQN